MNTTTKFHMKVFGALLTMVALASLIPQLHPVHQAPAERSIFAGAMLPIQILNGLAAPIGGRGQRDPAPMLTKVLSDDQFARGVMGCWVIAEGYGDLNSERIIGRAQTITCQEAGGTAMEAPLQGYLVGGDGKTGVRGTLVTHQGSKLVDAMAAGMRAAGAVPEDVNALWARYGDVAPVAVVELDANSTAHIVVVKSVSELDWKPTAHRS